MTRLPYGLLALCLLVNSPVLLSDTVLPLEAETRDPAWLKQLPAPVFPLPKPKASAPSSAASIASPRAAPPPAIAAAPPPVTPIVAPIEPVEHLDPTETATDEALAEATIAAAPLESQINQVRLEVIPVPEMPLAPIFARNILEIEEIEEVEGPISDTGRPQAPNPCPADKIQTRDNLCLPKHFWQVQLLAGRDLSKVEYERDRFQRRHRQLLGDLELVIIQKPKPVNGKAGGLYRLRAKPIDRADRAHAWCAHVMARGEQPCLVVRSLRVAATPQPNGP